MLLVRLQLRMVVLQLVQHVEEEQHQQVTPEQVPVQSVGDPTVRCAGVFLQWEQVASIAGARPLDLAVLTPILTALTVLLMVIRALVGPIRVLEATCPRPHPMDTPELVHTQAVVALKLHWRLVLACWPVMLWDTIIIIGMVTAKLTCSGCSVYLDRWDVDKILERCFPKCCLFQVLEREEIEYIKGDQKIMNHDSRKCVGRAALVQELGREGVIPAFQLMEPIRAMS